MLVFSFYVIGTGSLTVLVSVSVCDSEVARLYFHSMFLALSLSLSWSLSLFVMAQLNTCIVFVTISVSVLVSVSVCDGEDVCSLFQSMIWALSLSVTDCHCLSFCQCLGLCLCL